MHVKNFGRHSNCLQYDYRDDTTYNIMIMMLYVNNHKTVYDSINIKQILCVIYLPVYSKIQLCRNASARTTIFISNPYCKSLQFKVT